MERLFEKTLQEDLQLLLARVFCLFLEKISSLFFSDTFMLCFSRSKFKSKAKFFKIIILQVIHILQVVLLCLKRNDSQTFKSNNCKKIFLQRVCYG